MPEIGLFPQGHLALFLLAMIEGPVIVTTAAAVADALKFHLGAIWSIAVAADLAGDLLLYSTGRFLSHMIPDRFRTKTPKADLTRLFHQSGGRILVIAKLTHVAGMPTLLAAGCAQMPVLRFLWWNLVGTVPKVTALVVAGWTLGSSAILLMQVTGGIGWTPAALVGLGIAISAIWWLRRTARC